MAISNKSVENTAVYFTNEKTPECENDKAENEYECAVVSTVAKVTPAADDSKCQQTYAMRGQLLVIGLLSLLCCVLLITVVLLWMSVLNNPSCYCDCARQKDIPNSVNRQFTESLQEIQRSLTEKIESESREASQHIVNSVDSLNSTLFSFEESMLQRCANQASDGSPNSDKQETTVAISTSFTTLPSFMRHASSCYYFGEQLLTWEDAKHECNSLNGSLTTILSAKERTAISQHLKNNTDVFLRRGDVWIGLKELRGCDKQTLVKSRTWQWDATRLTANNLFWGPGEPNSCDEKCVGLMCPSDQTDCVMMDLPCELQKTFVCKYRACPNN